MKHRNIIAVIIFSIITLGIYDLYWLVKTKKVLNQQTQVHTPSVFVLFSPILLAVVLTIAAIVIAHGHSHTVINNANGIITTSSSSNRAAALALFLDLLALLLFLPIWFYWFFKFSKAVNVYTNGEMSTALTFILLWLLHLIGVAIVQDKFNDMLDAGANGGMPTPGGAVMSQGFSPSVQQPPAAPVASSWEVSAQQAPDSIPASTGDPVVVAPPQSSFDSPPAAQAQQFAPSPPPAKTTPFQPNEPVTPPPAPEESQQFPMQPPSSPIQ